MGKKVKASIRTCLNLISTILRGKFEGIKWPLKREPMKHVSIFLIFLMLFTTSAVWSKTETTWRDPKGNYTLTYPEGYEARIDPKDGSLNLFHSSTASTINFLQLAEKVPFKDLAIIEKNTVRRFESKRYTILARTQEKFQGNPGFRIDLGKKRKGPAVRLEVHLFFWKAAVYMFMGIWKGDSYTAQREDFQKIMGSLRFTDR